MNTIKLMIVIIMIAIIICLGKQEEKENENEIIETNKMFRENIEKLKKQR